MKIKLLIAILLCSLTSYSQNYENYEIGKIISDGSNTFAADKYIPIESIIYDNIEPSRAVSNKFVVGNFNKDSKMDTLNIYSIFTAQIVEGGIVYDITISFNDPNIPKLVFKSDRKEIIIINETDLNSDGVDEFSIFSPPLHGRTYLLSTYTSNDCKWVEFFDPELYPTACSIIEPEFLSNLIWKQEGKVFRKELVYASESFLYEVRMIYK